MAMILAGFITGIFLLEVCCCSAEKYHNKQILKMTLEEWRFYKQTGRYPRRKK